MRMKKWTGKRYCVFAKRRNRNEWTEWEELQKTLNDLRGGTQDFQQCVDAIKGTVQEIVQLISPFVEDIVKLIKEITDAVFLLYPNKRVLRLALYHPKERVRKKNMRRIMRWVEKLH